MIYLLESLWYSLLIIIEVLWRPLLIIGLILLFVKFLGWLYRGLKNEKKQ